MFIVTVEEFAAEEAAAAKDGHVEATKRYVQIVEALDLNALIQAVNRKPRAPRKPRTKDAT